VPEADVEVHFVLRASRCRRRSFADWRFTFTSAMPIPNTILAHAARASRTALMMRTLEILGPDRREEKRHGNQRRASSEVLHPAPSLFTDSVLDRKPAEQPTDQSPQKSDTRKRAGPRNNRHHARLPPARHTGDGPGRARRGPWSRVTVGAYRKAPASARAAASSRSSWPARAPSMSLTRRSARAPR
jgi:hypothetical protein